MCGRYVLSATGEQIAEHFALATVTPVARRYNIAPTQQAPVVRIARGGERELVLLRWGLVPFWAKDPAIGQRQINARAESLASRPAYRDAFRRRRCLVPATGFYEWKPGPRRKQPYLCRLPSGAVFAFAGLWESWRSPEGEVMQTFAIVTADASDALRALHDRMPVIVPESDYALWLSDEAPERLLIAPDAMPLAIDAVGLAVNNVRNEGPELVVPIGEGGDRLV
jgi:putative SOS response-associated peptidase YedK